MISSLARFRALLPSSLGMVVQASLSVLLMTLALNSNLASAASVSEILKDYYRIYYEPKQCQGIIANNGASDGEGNYHQSGYCIEVDRQVQVETEQGKRLYVLVTGDIAFDEGGNEAFGAHVYSGLVGMLVLKPINEGWEVEYANPAMTAGSYGKGLRDWKLVQVAPDKWGFINIHSDSHWIYSGSAFVLLTPDNRDITRSWIEAAFQHSDGGSGSAGACENKNLNICEHLKAQLDIDKDTLINGFFPLIMTVNGHQEDKVYKNTIYQVVYQPPGGYQVPKDYPMREASF